jgi:hypothetical protein
MNRRDVKGRSRVLFGGSIPAFRGETVEKMKLPQAGDSKGGSSK